MSKAYTADGKRRSSMTHANHSWTCDCGRTVRGNGGKSSHQRSCRTWAEAEVERIDRFLSAIEGRGFTTDTEARERAKRDELRERLHSTASMARTERSMMDGPSSHLPCPRCRNGEFWLLRDGAIICADEDCHARFEVDGEAVQYIRTRLLRDLAELPAHSDDVCPGCGHDHETLECADCPEGYCEPVQSSAPRAERK